MSPYFYFEDGPLIAGGSAVVRGRKYRNDGRLLVAVPVMQPEALEEHLVGTDDCVQFVVIQELLQQSPPEHDRTVTGVVEGGGLATCKSPMVVVGGVRPHQVTESAVLYRYFLDSVDLVDFIDFGDFVGDASMNHQMATVDQG